MNKTKILFNTWKELSCGNWIMIDGDDNGYSPVIAQGVEDIVRKDYSELTAPYQYDWTDENYRDSDDYKQSQQFVDEINKIFGTSFEEDDFAGR
jgi:hypothetical protein